MSEPVAPMSLSRWRNPWFLLVFVPCAAAWLAVFGWLTWFCFNPVTDWVGRQNDIVQEILGTVLWAVWVVLLVCGFVGASMFAERIVGIQPLPLEIPLPAPLPPNAKAWARGRNTLSNPHTENTD